MWAARPQVEDNPSGAPAPGDHPSTSTEKARLTAAERLNPDLAPTPDDRRDWGALPYAALWAAAAASLTSWSLVSVGLAAGLAPLEALLATLLGGLAVAAPLVLTAHAGARYGVPFPVLLRVAFGLRGAALPTLLRALAGAVWFGLESWIGGFASYLLLALLVPGFEDPPAPVSWLSFPGPRQLATFLGFVLLQVGLALALRPGSGAGVLRVLVTASAPLLLVLPLALLVAEIALAPGEPIELLGASLQPDTASADPLTAWWLAASAAAGLVALAALNGPDVGRFARSQRAQAIGQAAGLLGGLVGLPLLGLLATLAGVTLFPEALPDTRYQQPTLHNLWNPLNLLTLLTTQVGPAIVLAGLVFVLLAQLTTNLALHLLGAATAFEALGPRRLGWRAAVLLTAALGVAVQPWALSFTAGAVSVLSAASGLFGAVVGVVVADYWLLRRRRLSLDALDPPAGRVTDEPGGPSGRPGAARPEAFGVNPWAFLALAIGVVPPGAALAVLAGWAPLEPGIRLALGALASGSWLPSLALGGASYALLMRAFAWRRLQAQLVLAERGAEPASCSEAPPLPLQRPEP